MSSFEFRAGEDVPHAVRRIVRHQIDSLRAELRRAPRRDVVHAFYVHFKNREEFLLAIAENVLQAILDAGVSAGAEGGVASSIERVARALESGVWPLLPKIGVATVRMVDAIDRWPTIRLTFDRFLTIAIERLTHIAEREQAAGHIRGDVGARDLATLLVTMAMGTIMLMNTGVRTERGKRRALLLEMIRPPKGVAEA
jgi:AcrR family transcriptional regulator